MFRTLATIAVLLLLQGCSAVKLGYSQLPTLSYWWLDSAVSFNDTQSAQVKTAIGQFHQWHRTQELATYADVIQRSLELGQGKVQASQVCSLWSDVRTRLDRSVHMAISQSAPVLTLLGPRQLSHLARHFDSRNEDWDHQWLQGSPSERMARRQDKALERYRSFYGDLSDTQVALVKSQVQQSSWSPEWGRQDRLRREQDLLSALRRVYQSEANTARAEAEMRGVWQRWFTPPEEADRRLVQKMMLEACDNLAQLHNSTTPEQRQRAARTLRAYERDIRDLTAL
jgi:hypothetical protein